MRCQRTGIGSRDRFQGFKVSRFPISTGRAKAGLELRSFVKVTLAGSGGGGLSQSGRGAGAITAVVAEEAFLFRGAGKALGGHFAVAHTKSSVSLQPRRQAVVDRIAAHL